ncbi:MAG: LD-carboxypeptidase [Deltaproteobacteria bacterium]|nr:LD-carboxypeptidase [Deltaproteobacteria bacterium]
MQHLPIIRPPRLRKGDVVGVISPAGPVEEAELRPGLEFLDQEGFRVQLGSHALDKQGYLAGDDSARLNDFHAMFSNPEVRAIFCTRGGYGTMRILERIQYDLVRKNPKMFIGFSDITALLLSLLTKAGLVSFHGPMVRQIKDIGDHNFSLLLDLLETPGEQTLELPGARALLPGRAEGILIGGNLCVLSHLVGTSFLPSLEGSILFLEDRGEPLYRIDRTLTHLRLAGHLERISGLIAGQFEDCGERGAIDDLLFGFAKDLSVPVLSGAPIGHGDDNITLPLGVRAELRTTGPSLRLLEPCVSSEVHQ